MPIRYDDSLGVLIRDMLQRHVAGAGPPDDMWERIRNDLETEASIASQRRLTAICINPVARLSGILRQERAHSVEF